MPFASSRRTLASALLCALPLLHAPRSQAQAPADSAQAPLSSTSAQPQLDNQAPDFANAEPTPEAAPPASIDNAETTPQPKQSAPQVLEAAPLRAIAARLKKPLPLKNGRVVILKNQRTLQIFDGQTLLKSYSVSLGTNPSGRKEKRGDGRTPEGEYFICTRNDRTSAFHIFLGLSYPALPDAVRGAQWKAITPREMQVIRSRLASRSAPPWNTRLGGWVGIHGGSDAPFANRVKSKRQSLDWTAGCIAVSNAEIDEISAALKVGARVSIRP